MLLDPRKNFSTKACCLVHRLMLVGCHDPSEQTLKWGLALLMMCSFDELPNAEVRREKLQDLKSIVHAQNKSGAALHRSVP